MLAYRRLFVLSLLLSRQVAPCERHLSHNLGDWQGDIDHKEAIADYWLNLHNDYVDEQEADFEEEIGDDEDIYYDSEPDGMMLCGTPEPSEEERIEMGTTFAEYDAAIRRLGSNKLIRIPVVFHVLKKTKRIGHLSKIDIKQGYMAYLNRGFKDSNFRFLLQSVRTKINKTLFACENLAAYKQRNRIGGPNVLNIYLCNTAAKGYAGASMLPPITRASNRNLAAMGLIHETGHWLGLLHTFVSGCSRATEKRYGNYPSYYINGDGVADTPAQRNYTWAYTAKSTCYRKDKLDTCKDNKFIDNGRDPVDNYMNYIGTDCMMRYGRFTEGQLRRCNAEYRRFRDPKNNPWN